MKLQTLKLTNFRGYYKEQTIQFSTDSIKNVTVINGNNGEGKTSLLIALLWCLYGSEDYTAGDLVNKRARSEAKKGDIVDSEVELAFSHDGERYTVTRTLSIRVQDGRKWEPYQSNLTMFKIKTSGNFEKIANPAGVIESIIPQNVSPYFFFDAEKIDEFAKPGHDNEVRESVRNVLKIEVLERARNHLRAAAKDYASDLSKQATGEQQDLLEQQRQAEEDLDSQRTALENNKKEQIAGNSTLSEISDKLGQLEDSRKLEEKRTQIQQVLKAKEEERDRLWLNIRALANESFPPLLGDIIENAISILDEKRKRGEIPPGIREQLLKDLIERGRCICGRPIKEGGAEHDCLIQLLKKSFSSELENAVINSAGALRALGSKLPQMPVALTESIKTRVRLDREIEELVAAIDEISSHLQKSDHEDIAALEKKRQDIGFQLGSLAAKIANCTDKIEQLKARIDTLQADLDKIGSKEKRGRRLQQKMSLAHKAADAVDKIVDTFAAEMRKKIETEAKEIFQTLIWKDSQFPRISLDENYRLEVLDRWGLPARRDLSAGERQVLSLAFITGLSKVTGEEAPLVIDTPLARLSAKPKENITKRLPEITSQLVLLVTDEELHSQARRNIESRIGKEYKLMFDNSTGSTSIVQLGNERKR